MKIFSQENTDSQLNVELKDLQGDSPSASINNGKNVDQKSLLVY